MPHFSQADSRKVVRDKQAASKIDYSQLDEQLKQRPSDREERRMKKDFEDQLNKLNAEIESTSPNMKVGISRSLRRLANSFNLLVKSHTATIVILTLLRLLF